MDPALRVWLDINKMNRLDITSDDILQAIQQEQLEFPSGQIQNDKNEYNVRVMGESRSPEDFSKIRINNRISQGPNYKPALLKDVGEVEEGTADVRRISRMDGKLAVGLGIVKQHGSNAVEVGLAVRKKLEEIQASDSEEF